jgi:hypothetical protein
LVVRSKTDPKTVQALLRHSDVKTTLQLYAHSVSEDRMAAQGEMLEAILQSSSEAVNRAPFAESWADTGLKGFR